MKKTGKYEKKPKAGDLLLRTYLTSMVSLILCVSMFLGTSYAWFTSEVNNTQNEIYVGTLKVGLYKKVPDGTGKFFDNKFVSLSEVDANNKNTSNLFSSTIRWEPGYTALETITVKNEGDLAFHYVMNFIEAAESNNEATENDGAETEATENTATEKNTTEQVDLEAVAKMFEVYVFNHRANTYKTPTSYGDITANGSGWTRIGTLAEVLDGKVVLEGNMVSVREEGQEEAVINEGTTDGLATTDTYTIALHMKESATAEVMGQRISLNVKLLAYQKAEEEDVFGNYLYDTVTTVTNAKELSAAFKTGGIISLASDIVAEDIATLGAIYGKSVDLYLNGYDITATLTEKDGCNSTELFYVANGGSLTIHGDGDSNIHVKAAQSKKNVSAVINNCGGTVVINGGNYSMEYGAYSEDYLIPTIIDNNSTNGAAIVTINGGTFTHGRNMFRNFSNNKVAPAKLVINGGTFNGKDGEFEKGTIWNQKANENIPVGGGVVELNGGTYNHMRICTGFGNTKDTSGVSIKGVENLTWTQDDKEWIVSISDISTEIN